MSEIAIRVEGLSKKYRLGRAMVRHDTLRDSVMHGLRSSFQNFGKNSNGANGKADNTLWSLKNVSFEVKPGEVVGIIGRNGAGKSTLLKILSRITEPTEGVVEIHGRVGSLLEVGTGFHPELTGRENIYLNGAILGMKRMEIERKFDEIAAFAEIENFLDTPVKYFSSGMYVRLAFAVAAHLEPEILIVDEVLAVGDAAFQKKCLGKMGDIAKQGRTVLFVSHNMNAVQQLTSTGFLLDHGRLICQGSTAVAVARYLEQSASHAAGVYQGNDLERIEKYLSRRVEFRRLEFNQNRNGMFSADKEISICIEVIGHEDVEKFRFSLTIFQVSGNAVGSVFSAENLSIRKNQTGVFNMILRDLSLAPGKYYFGMATGKGTNRDGHLDFDIVTQVLHFEVAPLEGVGGTMASWSPLWGAVRFPEPIVMPVESDARRN